MAKVTGDSKNNNLFGTEGSDTIFGYGGDDYLVGFQSNDRLYGGTGDDTLNGDAGRDTLSGGTGTNYLYGGAGNDIYILDLKSGRQTANQISEVAGEGVDHFDFQVSADNLRIWSDGNGYNFQLINPTGRNSNYYFNNLSTDFWDRYEILSFEGGESWMAADGLHAIGLNIGQTTYGTSEGDWIEGRGGNDWLEGGDGDDTLDGGVGRDYVYGGKGSDTYILRPGDGTILAGEIREVASDEGVDTLRFVDINFDDIRMWSDSHYTYIGIPGSDSKSAAVSVNNSVDFWDTFERMEFADGKVWTAETGFVTKGRDIKDEFYGTSTKEGYFGLGGNDYISTYGGDDHVFGGNGRDVIYGDSGNDTLNGGAQGDYIHGGKDDDLLIGGAGDDEIYGDDGRDVIVAGKGDDLLFGGAGKDTFVFSSQKGKNTIFDLQDDTLDFSRISEFENYQDVVDAARDHHLGVIITLHMEDGVETGSVQLTGLQEVDLIFVDFLF